MELHDNMFNLTLNCFYICFKINLPNDFKNRNTNFKNKLIS